MKEQPGHIDERELARILHGHWGLAPAGLRHLPVGFGDHHWELTDAAGCRWFVTVAGLAGGWRGTGPEAGYADLRAAMETVIALGRAGLEFAVAPVPTAGGQALAPLGQRHAVTVFPYLDGAAADFGHGLSGPDRHALIGIVARLHGATPLARRTAPPRSPQPASRRDLWMVAGDDAGAAGRYAELTGRRVSGAAMDLYRLRWSLDDIALFVRDFRGPHERDEDTALAWEGLTEEMGRI